MLLLSDMKAQVLTFKDVKCEAKQLDRKYHLDTTNYRGTNNASSVISCLTLK